MHQIRFRLGLRPRPRWGRLQRSPRPLVGFKFLKGPTSKWRGGNGREREDNGGQGKGAGREREGKGEGERRDKGREGREGQLGSPTHYFRLKSCTRIFHGLMGFGQFIVHIIRTTIGLQNLLSPADVFQESKWSKMRWWPELRPDPVVGAYSAPQTPYWN